MGKILNIFKSPLVFSKQLEYSSLNIKNEDKINIFGGFNNFEENSIFHDVSLNLSIVA